MSQIGIRLPYNHIAIRRNVSSLFFFIHCIYQLKHSIINSCEFDWVTWWVMCFFFANASYCAFVPLISTHPLFGYCSAYGQLFFIWQRKSISVQLNEFKMIIAFFHPCIFGQPCKVVANDSALSLKAAFVVFFFRIV